MSNKDESTDTSTPDRSSSWPLWVIVFIAVLVAAIPLYYYHSTFSNQISTEHIVWASYGSFLSGTVGTVFVFASFVILVWTLHVQRQELRETRKVNEDAARALEEQAKLIDRQNFEMTFFNLLKVHNEMVDSLVLQPSNHDSLRGRAVLYSVHGSLISSYRKKVKGNPYEGRKLEELEEYERQRWIELHCIAMGEAYSKWYDNKVGIVGHYFLSVISLLKYIDGEGVDGSSKYADILKSHFNTKELALLLYHGIHMRDKDDDSFILMSNRLGLFEAIDKSELMDEGDVRSYTRQAFGDKKSLIDGRKEKTKRVTRKRSGKLRSRRMKRRAEGFGLVP